MLQSAKPDYRFDLNRVVVIGPFGQPFEPRAGFRPRPWHTIVPIEPRLFPVAGREKLKGGLCSVGFEAKVACQATIEYVRRFYRLHPIDKLLSQDRLEKYVASAIQQEIAATSWDELMSEKGLLDAEARINKAVEKDLLHNSIDVTCSCHLGEPQVHGLDADGKAPRLVLGGDARKRLEAETHHSEMDLKEQRRQQDLEVNSATERAVADQDEAVERGRSGDSRRQEATNAADARARALARADQERRNSDERDRKQALDVHERAIRTAEADRQGFDARLAVQTEISGWEIHREKEAARMQMESDLRQRALSGHALDEQFVEHETRMLSLETERTRAERERADVEKRADQAIEKTEIELLRERLAAEHSWELERLDRHLRCISQAVEKLGGASQPVERLSIVQFPSGAESQVPNSPAYQLAQAGLVIRELFKLFTDQK